METTGNMRSLAEGQHGLVTRAQLTELNITRGTRRGLIRDGDLVAVGKRVYRVGGAPLSDHQLVLGACLDLDGVASHRTAAWLHDLGGFHADTPLEVVTRRPKVRHDVADVRVHSTTWLPAADLVVVRAVPTLSVARTLLSLASLVPHELTYDRFKGLVDEAVKLDKASDPWLWWRLERLRRSGRNGVRVLEQVLLDRAGGQVTESWLEQETLRVIHGAGLPLPVCQARIAPRGAFVARVDFHYPNTMVVIEVSGHRWHRTREQITADARRRRKLVLAGYTLLEYTYDDIMSSPHRLVAEISRALGLQQAA